jgi:chemotaxis protein methyltransferase CheR
LDITITDKEFELVRDIMYKNTGVFLRDSKKPLVIVRLKKRLEELGYTNFTQYIDFFNKNCASEMEFFVNAITTNETFFYRHEKQFEYLTQTVFPEIMKNRPSREIAIWSAACSSGEEPYTLALVCKDFFASKPGWKYSIYASDINSKVIAKAKEAVYSERSVSKVPPALSKKFFTQQAKETFFNAKFFALDRSIVNSVTFMQHNLLKPFPKQVDVVFLRNALIYFEPKSKQTVLETVTKIMRDDGYLFLSPAENTHDVNVPLDTVGLSIYRKRKV